VNFLSSISKWKISTVPMFNLSLFMAEWKTFKTTQWLRVIYDWTKITSVKEWII